MSDEVGKVSLGLDLVAGNELTKQITSAAGAIGSQLTKSLQSTFGGFSLKGFADNIAKTLKSTTEQAMNGIAAGMESSLTAVESRLTKTISTADEAMKAAIAENRTAAETAIDSIADKLSGMKAPDFLSGVKAGAQAACCCDGTTGGKAPSASRAAKAEKEPKEPFDVGKAEAEIERLTQIMDNVNGKIDVQQQKLAKLKDAYENTYNDDTKLKLQEKILNTEAAILRLTKTSEDAAGKVWKLEDAIDQSKAASQQAADAAKQAAAANQQVTTTSQQAANANNQAAASAQQATNANQQLAAAAQQASNANNQASGSAQGSSNANRQAGNSTRKLTGNLNAAAKASMGASNALKTAGKSAGVMNNQFTQAFSRIAKQVLVFAVLYKAIRGFQSYMNSSMKTNQEYAASLNAIKSNLATAFQPIFTAVMPAINSFMSWLAKATAYVAAFMSSLFGTTYKKSFEAAKGLQTARKELDGYGKAAKKAGNGLSALDDFNLIKTKPDEDAAGTKPGEWEMEMPDLDIDSMQTKTDTLVANMKNAFNGVWESVKGGWKSATDTFGPTLSEAGTKIKPEIEGWKTTFQKVFSEIKTLGEPLKNWWQNDVIPMWQNGILMAAKIIAGLSESVRMVFDDIWAAAFPIIDKFVKEGLPRITEFVTGVQEIFGSMFGLVKQIFDDIWRDAVKPAIDLVSKIIKDALDIIFKWWDNWGKKIMAGLKEAIDKLKELWSNLWEKFLKPITQSALKFLTDLWDNHLKGLVTEILDFIGILANAALDIFNKFVMPIVNWLVKTLGPIFAEVFDGIIRILGSVLGGIIDAVKGIIKALGGIIEFIAGVFTGDWKRAWEGIKKFMRGIGDAIIGIFKGAVNAVIDAINWMLRQINKINIDIPDWVPVVGGKNIGFSIPEIPKLAKGGLAYGPTLAMVGDNKGASVDPEVVSPLSKLQDMLAGNNAGVEGLLAMVLEVLRDIARKDPSIKIGETELTRAVSRSSNGYYNRGGSYA